ncbi:MAG: hypothetical protein Q7V14_06380, partial [Coriobacteriia bacterium]|nr:hypothetical protein [Coriobacteriia bacterium]
RARPTLPHGHGEVLTAPAYEIWAALALSTASASTTWDVVVDGVPLSDLRRTAQAEAIALARAFCERFDIEVTLPHESPVVIVTGHQPEFFHPGVWIKNFLVDRLAGELSESLEPAIGLNLVVDSDGFDSVMFTAPCLGAEVKRCSQYLAVGSREGCYAYAGVPSAYEIDEFCQAGSRMLHTLPAPAIGRHFEEFCAQLKATAPAAANLAELLAVSRRRFEAPAQTRYLELPVTQLASTSSFMRFVRHLAANAHRFKEAYNAELASFREATQTRSLAQPFPDLAFRDGAVELPVWVLGDGARRTLWAHENDGALLVALPGNEGFVPLSADDRVAPKALALTMFTRLLVADLFVHGVGGGRYDRVTDGVMTRFFGIPAPPFAVTSMTVYLPLGGHVVDENELAGVRQRINRLQHNPDAMLPEVDFDSAEEQSQALALAAEKSESVEMIKQVGADKKALGQRIREINTELRRLLQPLERQLASELELLEGQAAAAEVFTDRTYPFFLWNPLEIQDKAR